MSQKILLPLTLFLFLAFPTLVHAGTVLPVTGPKQPVILQQVTHPRVKELPKTGLPPYSFILIGLIPIGYKLRNFGQDKDDFQPSAKDIWSIRSSTR